MWLYRGGRARLNIAVAVCVLVVSTASLMYWGGCRTEWIRVISDSKMAMAWEGFGPEKGLYNFTVVTAMIDIGRGTWGHQTRPFNRYLLYMQRLLRLDVNMVAYVDKKARPFIEWMRRGREARTQIIVIGPEDLPYHRYRDRMSEIMKSDEYKQNNELVEKQLCESYVPEYDILQLSKLYFMNRTVCENPFHSTYFMWLDGGYGHGDDIYPRDGVWMPHGLFEHARQITFIERSPGVAAFEKDKSRLHKMSINILAGLFFAGGGEAFKELYEMQKQQVDEWMRDGVVDDDQTMYMLLYYRKPSLFHLVHGDWNDVFKLFTAKAQAQ